MKTKQCKVCGSVLNVVPENFRTVNRANGYTSKTCMHCEKLLGVNCRDISAGHIYLLEDIVFPGLVKVGMTVNLEKRLRSYNKDKPYPTASFIYTTGIICNVFDVEQSIIAKASNIQPPKCRKEWFDMEMLPVLYKLVSSVLPKYSAD